MASLAVKKKKQGIITLFPSDKLKVLKFKIFKNKYLYLYIVQFIFLDARTIISFQLTCNANRNWNSVVLKGFKDEWRWKKIEALVGKEVTYEIKDKRSSVKWLTKKGLNAEVCRILAPALCSTLKFPIARWWELCLDGNNIADEGCRHLTPALARMNHLGWLVLASNKIGDEGCRYLAPPLAQMKEMEVLRLCYNNIGPEGCRHLAPALAQMEQLETLDLMDNNIGDEGCRHLASALAQMKQLKRLNLMDNNIGDEGKKVLRDAWRKARKNMGFGLFF
jgi:hypothetical protein